jgi:hypothetical protein
LVIKYPPARPLPGGRPRAGVGRDIDILA